MSSVRGSAEPFVETFSTRSHSGTSDAFDFPLDVPFICSALLLWIAILSFSLFRIATEEYRNRK